MTCSHYANLLFYHAAGLTSEPHIYSQTVEHTSKGRHGLSGVLKALLLERNGQLFCNPKKKKKKKADMHLVEVSC